MSPCELVSELQYHRQLTIEQIARLDDVQIGRCLNLPRDSRGNLVGATGLPPGVEVDEDGNRVISSPCNLGAAVVKAKKHHGVDVEVAKKQYRAWWMREFEHSAYAK